MEQAYDAKKLAHDLEIDARGVGIPDGAAKIFAQKVIKDLEKVFEKKMLITEQDLKRAILKELKKYHADFAYVYENRDKII